MAKFAVFIPSLAGGGAERVAVTLANEFAAMGHETHLIVGTTLPSKYQNEVHELVQVHLMGASRVLFAIPKLATFIRKVQPEAIISIMAYASVAMKLAAVLSGQNTRLYTREAISNEFKEENKDGTYTPLFVKLLEWTYNTSNGIVSPSLALSESLKKAYPKQSNIVHINSPVITSTFLSQENDELPKLPWSINEKAKLVVSAGRLSDQKDFKTLINALQLLRKKIDCKLIILGEGPEREALEQQIKNNNMTDHCLLPGFVDNPLPYFKHADLFVLSSKHEGLPNVLIQALACGTKVVSTDCPTGPMEILGNGRYGRLVEVGKHESMATAMYESLTNNNRSEQQSIANLTRETYWAPFVSKKFAQFMQNTTD